MSAALGRTKYFTTLDLKSCYWQIPLNEGAQKETVFTCHRCLHKYNVVHIGLANAPGISQAFMPIILHGLGDFAMPHLDDIIIFSESEEHKQHIQKTFDYLSQNNLK